jgi:hypothetical protein
MLTIETKIPVASQIASSSVPWRRGEVEVDHEQQRAEAVHGEGRSSRIPKPPSENASAAPCER